RGDWPALERRRRLRNPGAEGGEPYHAERHGRHRQASQRPWKPLHRVLPSDATGDRRGGETVSPPADDGRDRTDCPLATLHRFEKCEAGVITEGVELVQRPIRAERQALAARDRVDAALAQLEQAAQLLQAKRRLLAAGLH